MMVEAVLILGTIR